MRKPTDGSILQSRVRANNDWLAQCGNLHREESVRIGQLARKARETRGLSLREMAIKMKISAPFLSDLERGNRNWTTHTMEAWAAIIDASNT